MKMINFTDPPSSQKATTSWWAQILLFLGMITTSGTALYLHFNARKLLYKRQKAHATIAEHAQRIQELQQDLALLREEKKQFQKDVERAGQKAAEKELPMQFLEQLAALLPAELCIKKVTFGKPILIEGVSAIKHQQKIQQLVARCLDHSWCPFAELEISPGPEEHLLAFTISINKST